MGLIKTGIVAGTALAATSKVAKAIEKNQANNNNNSSMQTPPHPPCNCRFCPYSAQATGQVDHPNYIPGGQYAQQQQRAYETRELGGGGGARAGRIDNYAAPPPPSAPGGGPGYPTYREGYPVYDDERRY
ncbi:uncharacterized protein EHS24_006952 [Apiotrichum porosum]|uniref:Uncharacterized protein n=1 Tax=Apiotrichum porosum TaxID=105984 RepID=A0A427XWV2_9TREE|nr:uncharacterized protein EHS24_006952 [Apiotrichum porosum]RSH83277.1 hypothetical protein EHS24_006952 [Apiotrichum porosum]